MKASMLQCLFVVLAAIIMLLFSVNVSAVSEDAKRYFDRAMAAVEMGDSEGAIREFEKAKSLAPNWPDVYYNLGMVQEKAEKYDDAAANLKQYLRLAPKAKNAAAVKSHINKLEYKAEKAEEEKFILQSIAGRWIGVGSNYNPQLFMFHEENGQIYITYETTHIMGRNRERFGWNTIPVKREGKNISFRADFKLYDPHTRKIIDDRLYNEYNLELVDSDTLMGSLIGSKGSFFFIKDRDGSIWQMSDDVLNRHLRK